MLGVNSKTRIVNSGVSAARFRRFLAGNELYNDESKQSDVIVTRFRRFPAGSKLFDARFGRLFLGIEL